MFLAAQQPPIKRIPLQKYDVPGTELETVVGIAEIAPDVLIGRHTHPGPESGYLLEGEFGLMVDGQPPKPLKAGEGYQSRLALSTTPGAVQAAPRFWQCTSCAKASRWRSGEVTQPI